MRLLMRSASLLCMAVAAVLTAAEYPVNMPSNRSFDHCLSLVRALLSDYHNQQVPLEQRNLVMFHIGDIGIAQNSIDIAGNNIKIFVSSVLHHSAAAKQKAFYLFNVVKGMRNPLAIHLPSFANTPNMAMLEWKHASSDLGTHLQTVGLLGHDTISQFYSVVFLNQGVRGPLASRREGEWLLELNKLMFNNNVALAGPTISCEVSPHVQTHAFVLRSDILPHVLQQMKQNMSTKFVSWQEMIASLEVGLTGVVMRAGYNVSALLYDRRGYSYFQEGKCLQKNGPRSRFELNPASWCDVTPEEVIFIKYGGEPMRTPGFMCNSTIAAMDDYLYSLSSKEPELKLIYPETLMGGHYYELYSEYNSEIARDKSPLPVPKPNSQPKVCFLVRVTTLDEIPPQENAYSKLLNKDVELLVTSLRRQTNPNWAAFFYLVHQRPVVFELQQLLAGFDDSRLFYVPLSAEQRPVYTASDAGYTATDLVLSSVLGRTDCEWISLTTGDNAYGSEVVHRVLNASPMDMIINPMDSRRFLQLDQSFRNRKLPVAQRRKAKWSEYCVGMDANLRYNSMTYALRAVPRPGRIDSAAVFLSRDKLQKEALFFSDFTTRNAKSCLNNITDPADYPCLGNQAAHLISYLCSNRHWVYKRLPLDGLKSVVFHGNSPTICIASGHVWLDHPDPKVAKCISHTETLIIADIGEHAKYDFPLFDCHGDPLGQERTCLRLSEKQFAAQYHHLT